MSTGFPDYPFIPQRAQIRPGITMSYLDEGPRDAEVVLALHGNPSWSYYWRHLVLGLRDRYRVIVPDHIGMGLSDMPDDGTHALPRYDYTLQSRIDDVAALLRHLAITGPLTLAVHDWGGMIGFGWALEHSAQVRRLIITNTAAFPMPTQKRIPWQIALGRNYLLGEWLIRAFNAFAAGAAQFGVVRKMPPDVRRAYVAPYSSWARRIATVRFMQDIPLFPNDRAWPLLEAANQALSSFADRPTFIGWGLQDFVFDRHFLARFEADLPKANIMALNDAGHYVLEDAHERLVPTIRQFLDNPPLE